MTLARRAGGHHGSHHGGHHFSGASSLTDAWSNAGQTTTEYLMIVGLITTVFIALSTITQRPFHAMMQTLLQCIADGTTNQLPCEQATMLGGGAMSTPPIVPPTTSTWQQTMGQLQGVFNSITNVLNTMLNGVQQILQNLRSAVPAAEPWRHT